MSLSETQAFDEILDIFNTAWTTNTPALNGGDVVRVEWPGLDAGETRDPDKPYATIKVTHVPSRQVTFGPTGSRRFERSGLVTIQVFYPLSRGDGLNTLQLLCEVARDAFEGVGTNDGLWFRNCRIQDIGSGDTWYQYNVVSEFEYDQIR